MLILKKILFLFFTFTLLSCGESVSIQKERLKLTNIVVTTSGSDEVNSFCRKFNLSDKQALLYFEKSFVVTEKIMHDKYDYLSCFVNGTSSLKNSSCEWEIRAGGTAEVICGKTNYLLACDKCDDLLRDSDQVTHSLR